jgi:4-hydroxyacetophenone monooxygenase
MVRVKLPRMRFAVSPGPITDDDASVRAALDGADPHALLVAVAHATGDQSILRDDLRPDQLQLLIPNAGLSPDQVAEARDLAAAALVAHRDAGSPPPPPLSPGDLPELLGFLAGETGPDMTRLLREELQLDSADLRAPDWHAAEIAPDRHLRIAIVGAGMSGIVAAHRLVQAGLDVVILDKNDEVGGTWLENTYPGCRVDVPSHLYSYSFLQTVDWPQPFSSQEVLLEYFRSCVDELGLREHIRLGTEVLGARFDDIAERWEVRTRTAGQEGIEHFDVVVSAVGQLNQPQMPAIAGIHRFAGESFHSARWRHDLDLSGRHVTVIGTGASAAQFIPEVAEVAAELTVYQRTPPWLIPTPDYHDEIPDGLRWVLRHLPDYVHWNRLWLFWRTHEGLLPAAEVDPDWWAEHDDSVSMLNEFVRQMLVGHLGAEVTDPEILAKVQPNYPPIAKRALRDNGAYTRALQADNVEIVTDQIAEITEKGVRTVDGTERPADVIVYGTGFQASKFLTPMRVTGRNNADLHERWGGDARAYLGITVPEFPNLFLLYGPNTNIVINGSIIYFSECEAHYIVDSVRTLLESRCRSLECRTDVHDAYNERIDEGNRRMAWGASEVNSWYKNASGRVAQNWPFSLIEYWQQTRRVNPDDYIWR